MDGDPPAPRGGLSVRLRRLWARLVAGYRAVPSPLTPIPVDRRHPSGLPSGPTRYEGWATLAGFLIGLGFGLFFLYYMLQAPVPPGGDPGEWTAGAAHAVGLPYASWYANSASPPLLGPFLGWEILLAHGPLGGALLFVVSNSILLGGTTYYAARALVQRPITALAATTFILADPAIISLYFSGAYQFLFSWVFLNLTIAFALRYVRSHRRYHLVAMALSGSAALLTHPAMFAEVPAFLVFLGLVLLMMGQLPKELITTWTGRLSVALVAGVGLFWYEVVPHLGLHQNNIAGTGAYFSQISTTLGSIWIKIYGPFDPTYRFDSPTSFELLVLVSVLVPLAFVAARFLRPQWLTLPAAALGVWTISITATAAVLWWREIITPYVRFGEILVFPVFLTGAVAIEAVLEYVAAIPAAPDRPGTAPRPRSLVWRHLRTSSRARTVVPLAVVAVALLGLGYFFDVQTNPVTAHYEVGGTKVAHNDSMLAAMGALGGSNIPGTVLTISHVTSWGRSLTQRDVIAPFQPGYALNEPHIVIEEEVSFALSARWAVTNSYAAATVSGNDSAFLSGTPTIQLSYFGFFVPVMQVVPQSLTVTLADGSVVTFYQSNRSLAPTVIPPAPGGSTLTLVFESRGVRLVENVTAIPGTRSLALNFTAEAVTSAAIESVSARLQSPPKSGGAEVNVTGPGTFSWFSPRVKGGLGLTEGRVTPAGALSYLGHVANNSTRPAMAVLAANSTVAGGSAALGFALGLTMPLSENFVTVLPPYLNAPATWQQLSASFFLSEGTGARGPFAALIPNILAYLEGEYGASLYWTNNDWTILLLPTAA